MTDEQKAVFLKEEYFFLQKTFEDYDQKSLSIKGWVVSGSAAAFMLGTKWKDVELYTILAILAVSITIWYIEIMWKMGQNAFADRIRTIEAYFRNDDGLIEVSVKPLQIYGSWYRSFRHDLPIYKYERDDNLRGRSVVLRFLRTGFKGVVAFPYVAIILICALVLWFKF